MIKKITFLSFICAAAIPFASYADITIVNNTNYYGTAKTDFSPCSSVADGGILQPHSSLTVKQALADSFCLFGCDVNLYLGKNCAANLKVGVAHVVVGKGITWIKNMSNGRLRLSGGGHYASLDPA